MSVPARFHVLAGTMLILGLSGCSPDEPDPLETRRSAANPFPSTYQVPASAPLRIRNATVLTGTGERLENADVVMEGGKIVAVGSGLAADGRTEFDASGLWITPGVIDVHSHLGVYASPQVDAHSDGNEATAANTAVLAVVVQPSLAEALGWMRQFPLLFRTSRSAVRGTPTPGSPSPIPGRSGGRAPPRGAVTAAIRTAP